MICFSVLERFLFPCAVSGVQVTLTNWQITKSVDKMDGKAEVLTMDAADIGSRAEEIYVFAIGGSAADVFHVRSC